MWLAALASWNRLRNAFSSDDESSAVAATAVYSDDDISQGAGCDTESNSDSQVECSWQYGFDAGSKAWRVLVGSSSENKEYASSLLPPVEGSSLAQAAFLDGTVHEIPGLIHSKVRGMKRKASDPDAVFRTAPTTETTAKAKCTRKTKAKAKTKVW